MRNGDEFRFENAAIRLGTQVGERGLSSLPADPVFQHLSGGEGLIGLICTSCKASEEAVAKCVVCDNLLCSNCNTAHKVTEHESKRTKQQQQQQQQQQQTTVLTLMSRVYCSYRFSEIVPQCFVSYRPLIFP